MDEKKLSELSDNSSYTISSYAEFTVIVAIMRNDSLQTRHSMDHLSSDKSSRLLTFSYELVYVLILSYNRYITQSHTQSIYYDF